jgi:hypothetical protein
LCVFFCVMVCGWFVFFRVGCGLVSMLSFSSVRRPLCEFGVFSLHILLISEFVSLGL